MQQNERSSHVRRQSLLLLGGDDKKVHAQHPNSQEPGPERNIPRRPVRRAIRLERLKVDLGFPNFGTYQKFTPAHSSYERGVRTLAKKLLL